MTKSRQPKTVGVELRAGEELCQSAKPKWTSSDMDK